MIESSVKSLVHNQTPHYRVYDDFGRVILLPENICFVFGEEISDPGFVCIVFGFVNHVVYRNFFWGPT